MKTLESLTYSRGHLQIIDQLKLPGELVYVDVKSAEDGWSVIRSMQVRGAPLIAIVAALSLAVHVETSRSTFRDAETVAKFLISKMEYLRTSRPTAVNLFVATDALTQLVQTLAKQPNSTAQAIIDAYIHGAEKMLEDDIATNKAIGHHGATRILEIVGYKPLKILTICNTGSLATAGYGTALGVVRSLHSLGLLEQVYACETRPYNQGARLTSFEIVSDKLPGTLITDSMASYLMATKGVDCVIVGADRVAANGDTANKIGTYQLAIIAKYHDVPFFTAVPTTTLDLSISSGSKIHVEERPAVELTTIFNQRIAPEGISVWNPSFDVTPSSLIRGVITEVGVAESSVGIGGIIDMAAFLKAKGLESLTSKSVPPVEMPVGYKPLDESTITDYLHSLSTIKAKLGGTVLEVKEVGDGNLNFVYIVSGINGFKVVVKQALPYVRCVGESWPLTLERAYFERNALVEHRQHAPDMVPEVYHFDKAKSLIVMRYVEPPHLILRKRLIEGVRISTFAGQVAEYAAKTLFNTSILVKNGGEFRSAVSEWSRNKAMCALTEKVIFTDPYTQSPFNRWTTPQLDSYANGIKADGELKLAATKLKEKFLTSTQALLHGDLHTGSVMVDEGSTFVIDPEFAFYGPIGFDVGAFISNLFLNYFSQSARGPEGTAYGEWILTQVATFYNNFAEIFQSLWATAREKNQYSELFPNNMYHTDELFAQATKSFMSCIYNDTLGFAGAKIIRRIVGIAHVADLDSIDDATKRAVCEKRALTFARRVLIAGASAASSFDLSTIEKVISLARDLNLSQPSEEWVGASPNNRKRDVTSI